LIRRIEIQLSVLVEIQQPGQILGGGATLHWLYLSFLLSADASV
jgi:hypothetical protein